MKLACDFTCEPNLYYSVILEVLGSFRPPLKYVLFKTKCMSFQANSLVRTAVSPQLKDDIKNNQELFATSLNVHSSDTALFVNGMFFDMDIVDVMTLLQTLRQELTTMEGLHSLGMIIQTINNMHEYKSK